VLAARPGLDIMRATIVVVAAPPTHSWRLRLPFVTGGVGVPAADRAPTLPSVCAPILSTPDRVVQLLLNQVHGKTSIQPERVRSGTASVNFLVLSMPLRSRPPAAARSTTLLCRRPRGPPLSRAEHPR
jgi:hypothetical protein